MSVVLKLIFDFLAIMCLYIATFMVVFYHMYDGNREAMDNHAIISVIFYIALFILFFNMGVL